MMTNDSKLTIIDTQGLLGAGYGRAVQKPWRCMLMISAPPVPILKKPTQHWRKLQGPIFLPESVHRWTAFGVGSRVYSENFWISLSWQYLFVIKASSTLFRNCLCWHLCCYAYWVWDHHVKISYHIGAGHQWSAAVCFGLVSNRHNWLSGSYYSFAINRSASEIIAIWFLQPNAFTLSFNAQSCSSAKLYNINKQSLHSPATPENVSKLVWFDPSKYDGRRKTWNGCVAGDSHLNWAMYFAAFANVLFMYLPSSPGGKSQFLWSTGMIQQFSKTCE